MNYRFKNLLGAPYRGGNAILSNNTHLLTPVGNRVTLIDLVKSETVTLPCENSKNITRIAVSPDGSLLLSVDEAGRCLLINLHRRVILHRISFKGGVTAVKFSRDGAYFAISTGKNVQVWRMPAFRKEFMPFELVRTLIGCNDAVSCLDWSPDGNWIIVGSKDLSVRIFCLKIVENYRPVSLLGHRDVIVGVFFRVSKGAVDGAYSVSKDGAIFSWNFYLDEVLQNNVISNDLHASFGLNVRNLDNKRKWEDEEDAEDFTVLINPNEKFENPKTTKPSETLAAETIKTLNPNKTLAAENTKTPKSNKTLAAEIPNIQNPSETLFADTVDAETHDGPEHSHKKRTKNQKKSDRKTERDMLGSHDFFSSKTDGDFKEMGNQERFSSKTDGNGEEIVKNNRNAPVLESKASGEDLMLPLHRGRWHLLKKDFFMQPGARLTACDYHLELDLVVVGFSSGTFGIYQMPDFTCIHLLSITREKITTAVFNRLGNWLAFGCAKLGQLLVWEWRSETYILKQQGHYFDVNCLAYSPDSQLIATGADDNKVKVWTASSGFCFVTFAEHKNAVAAVHFLPGNHALLSASLDGTVRAWDLFRYRNFRTFTTPTPKQFVSLAADPSGEVICAGTLDSYEIFVWSMKTGRLLDVMSGHEGPVHGLAFSPTNTILASSSWDRTVRLWDVFESKGAVEKFPHTHDVLTVTYRPDGKQIACSTLDGQIHFWDPIEGELMWTIEGRRDIAGGRLVGDRRTAANSSSGKCFTSLCYSADGSYIIAAGRSKYICMYDVEEQVLLQRFQISSNLSLDGVLDFLNSKDMTNAGPMSLIDDEDSDMEGGLDRQERGQLGEGLPGTATNHGRPVVYTKCLRISPTGRSWAAATTEGVLIYSIDDSFVFDPTDLDMDVTPEAVDVALIQGQHLRALILALRLNEASLIRKCVVSVQPKDVATVAAAVPSKYLRRLIEAFAEYLEDSPHLEFLLQWCQELCKVHGQSIQQNCKDFLPALRSLQKALTRLHQDLVDTCSSNEDLLQYLCMASLHS